MTLKAGIQNLVDRFSSDLENLVRNAAVEAVQSVLGSTLGGNSGTRALPAAPKKRPGPRPKSVSVEKATAPTQAAKTVKGTARVRRSAEDIARGGDEIAAYVKANPGSNAERIKAALGIASNQWSLAIGAALASKKVSRKGDRRAAVYSPVGAATIARPAPVPPIKRQR